MRQSLVLLVPILLFGCGLRESFQPRPPSYLQWTKTGASVLDVKKALLECGMPEPSGEGYSYRVLNYNEKALIGYCMERAGYRRSTPLGWCHSWPDLPVCQPDVAVPKPSVERRLNSDHCRAASSYAYCKANSINPRACDKMDFENPPPECRP